MVSHARARRSTSWPAPAWIRNLACSFAQAGLRTPGPGAPDLWCEDGHVLVSIEGYNLPGCVFVTPDGSLLSNLHVGVQVGREPAGLVKADALEAYWELDIHVDSQENSLDFRGQAVQGKRGERFVYLTWGDVGRDKDVRDDASGQADAESS